MLTAFTCKAGHPVRLTDTADNAALASAVWIDLRDPTPEESAHVAMATGLHVPTQAEVSEIETSSRLSRRGGALYLSLPMVTMADGPRGASAGFVLSPQRLITVRFAPSKVFETFAETMPRGDMAGDSGGQILIALLEAIVDRQADVLEGVQTELDTISHDVFSLGGHNEAGRKNEDRMLRDTLARLGRIADLLSHIRESQLGVSRLLPYIASHTTEWLPADLAARLRTLKSDIDSVGEFDNHLTNKLQFMLDATMGFINIAQNDVMKVMTVASVVGIPPVLVAGIYGMNFKNIPEYDWAWGYPYGLALIMVTALIPLAIFRWRKWI